MEATVEADLMTPSAQALLAVMVVYLSVWVPLAGLLWLARRRERQRMELLARQCVRQLEVISISRGSR